MKNPKEQCAKLYADWVSAALSRDPQKTKAGIAKAINSYPLEVNKLLSGARDFKAWELAAIGVYLGEMPPMLGYGLARVVGTAGNNCWSIPSSAANAEKIAFVPDDRYRELEHFAVRVHDNSADQFIPSNFYALCVPYFSARRALEHGDLVYCNLLRGPRAMGAIRLVNVGRNKLELITAANSANKQQSIALVGTKKQSRFRSAEEDIDILGLVIWRGAPMP